MLYQPCAAKTYTSSKTKRPPLSPLFVYWPTSPFQSLGKNNIRQGMRNYTKKNAARQLLEASSPQLTQLGKNVTPGLQASKDTQRFCERYNAHALENFHVVWNVKLWQMWKWHLCFMTFSMATTISSNAGVCSYRSLKLLTDHHIDLDS